MVAIVGAGYTGLSAGYWGGWDAMLIQGIFDPAAGYLLGALVLLFAERMAPFLLPGKWWR